VLAAEFSNLSDDGDDEDLRLVLTKLNKEERYSRVPRLSDTRYSDKIS